MNYSIFIYRVTTFSSTAKTQKEKVLLQYVNALEGVLLEGKGVAVALIDKLTEVVDDLNGRFPRAKAWRVTHAGEQIHIEPVDNDRRAFDSQALAVINYRQVKLNIPVSQLSRVLANIRKGGAI